MTTNAPMRLSRELQTAMSLQRERPSARFVEYEADAELRDYENVPLKDDVFAYFDREVAPHVADAWINREFIDEKDQQLGKVGYEINFSRYFYRYAAPRDLDKIDKDIRRVEKDILKMLEEVMA
jgi:type I restriction enzyme M protein